MQRLRTLIPTDLTMRTIVMLLLFAGLAAWFLLEPPTEEVARQLWPPFWIVGGGLVLISLFDSFLRRGYRVSYDDQAIYWRKVGFRGKLNVPVVMPFAAITDVSAEAGSLGVRPFEVAVLSARAEDIPDIMLSRLHLQKWDIKALLSEVSARSHASFDAKVRDFMEDAD